MTAVWFVLTRLARDRSALLGLVLIALLVVCALAAPLLATHPDDLFELHPAERLKAPSGMHWLGSDRMGADAGTLAAQRHPRPLGHLLAVVRASGLRRDARAAEGGLRREHDRARRLTLAADGAARAAEHRLADHRAGVHRHGVHHPDRGRPRIPGARPAATDTGVGPHDRRVARVLAGRVVVPDGARSG